MKRGVVTFSDKENEIFTKESLKSFLRANPNPKIVLRVPKSADNPTSEDSFSRTDVYNAIEKELLKAGFNVRDRGLFNEILGKTATNDYSKIKELTDTDLILELVSLKTDIEYHTNKYKSYKKNKNMKLSNGNITLYGALADFKVILVNSNELAGAYEFNYAPCTDGCGFYINANGNIFKRRDGKFSEIPAYEIIETDLLIDFMKIATKELIGNLK